MARNSRWRCYPRKSQIWGHIEYMAHVLRVVVTRSVQAHRCSEAQQYPGVRRKWHPHPSLCGCSIRSRKKWAFKRCRSTMDRIARNTGMSWKNDVDTALPAALDRLEDGSGIHGAVEGVGACLIRREQPFAVGDDGSVVCEEKLQPETHVFMLKAYASIHSPQFSIREDVPMDSLCA
jgi:hypothetical protein